MDPTFETSISFFEPHAIPDSQFLKIDLSIDFDNDNKKDLLCFIFPFMFYLSF
jgi:hypothetical protein